MALGVDYRILAINRANIDEFDRIYGRRPKVGDNLLDLLASQPDQQETSRLAWARAIAGEEFIVVESRGDPSRARSDYEIKFRTLTNDIGERIGAFQFVADVSQRLRDQRTLAEAQQALIQAQKLDAMGQLTGGVAHDFNNLLTPILGALDMLKRRGVGFDREQRLIQGALESAERARTLVHRLLAFARRQPLQAVSVDVAGLLQGMVDLIDSAMGPTVLVKLQVEDNIPLAKAEALEAERAAHPIHTAAVMLILFTSCRSSEVVGLRWSDIQGRKLHLRDSKTGPRTVWLGDEGRAVIDGIVRRRKVEWVFFNWATGRPIGRLDAYWARIRERTGFSTLRLHDLRHTYASHAAALSETLPTIGKLLGHQEVRSTAIYTHLDDEDVRVAAVELDDAVGRMTGRSTEGRRAVGAPKPTEPAVPQPLD